MIKTRAGSGMDAGRQAGWQAGWRVATGCRRGRKKRDAQKGAGRETPSARKTTKSPRRVEEEGREGKKREKVA